MRYLGSVLYWGMVLLLFVFMFNIMGHCQDVPAVVKQAIAASIKDSKSANATDTRGGMHEEGGLWGMTAKGTIVVIPAKSGKPNLKCGDGASILVGDAADPSLDADLASVMGNWHVHPSGVREGCVFVQPPSDRDISNTMGSPINIVIGSGDNTVYFYDATGVTKKMKLKEFLKP